MEDLQGRTQPLHLNRQLLVLMCLFSFLIPFLTSSIDLFLSIMPTYDDSHHDHGTLWSIACCIR